MIPVFQDRFCGARASDGSWEGGGNCAWACVATILGIPWADVRLNDPPCDQDMLDWTREAFDGHLVCHNQTLRYDYDTVPGPGIASWEGPHAFERWTHSVRRDWEPPETPFDGWMATIESPGLRPHARDPFYPHFPLHAVVFEGRSLAHDPNPKYQVPRATPQVLGMTWWTFA